MPSWGAISKKYCSRESQRAFAGEAATGGETALLQRADEDAGEDSRRRPPAPGGSLLAVGLGRLRRCGSSRRPRGGERRAMASAQTAGRQARALAQVGQELLLQEAATARPGERLRPSCPSRRVPSSTPSPYVPCSNAPRRRRAQPLARDAQVLGSPAPARRAPPGKAVVGCKSRFVLRRVHEAGRSTPLRLRPFAQLTRRIPGELVARQEARGSPAPTAPRRAGDRVPGHVDAPPALIALPQDGPVRAPGPLAVGAHEACEGRRSFSAHEAPRRGR